jgi:hypothetical protein
MSTFSQKGQGEPVVLYVFYILGKFSKLTKVDFLRNTLDYNIPW